MLGGLVLSNVKLMRNNEKLTKALEKKLPDQFIEKALETSPAIQTNLSEAIQQWTVNEQHLHLLDEIQGQQLKLISGLTNRVNQSASMIRTLEEQQDLLDLRAENVAKGNATRARSILPGPGGTDVSVPEDPLLVQVDVIEGDPLDGNSNEQTDIDIVLEEAFEGVQVQALLSRDNPAFSGIVVWDYDNQTGLVQLSNLPTLPADFTYQLWVFDPNYNGFVDGGAFVLPANSTPFEYTFRPNSEIVQASGYAVTAETGTGVDIPAGPVVVATANLLN